MIVRFCCLTYLSAFFQFCSFTLWRKLNCKLLNRFNGDEQPNFSLSLFIAAPRISHREKKPLSSLHEFTVLASLQSFHNFHALCKKKKLTRRVWGGRPQHDFPQGKWSFSGKIAVFLWKIFLRKISDHCQLCAKYFSCLNTSSEFFLTQNIFF